ncbi:MAG TPA: saccharopine dehydrogenase family protein [Chloroflexi bacterium]|nr:MAG: saccharopine dehydrogenase [Chloroflexota bacterium]HDN05317.1 saccharopine dehydrogenase family protein [Chloroflexota bacterium]
MNKKIIVLGAGLVGSAIVYDLAQVKEFQVTAADINTNSLEKIANLPGVKTEQSDLSNPDTLRSLIKDIDLVICAVPGFMGYQTLETVISAGKNVVDISFFPEDPFGLDDLAKEKGVTAVVDCGVAPGLCNIIAGYVSDKLDEPDYYHCYVGGLPEIREWPYEYKAVFSPADVLEEYTRPARLVENGQEVIYPALSGIELIDFPETGTLEAFNTDGLRTLRHTLGFPTMKEKTLRYPGHANLMRTFRESGFFSSDPVEVDGSQVIPLSLTSRLLFDQWFMKEGEKDLTVMQVVLKGKEKNKQVVYQYDLLDHFNEKTGITSMARTTGYTCTIVARQLLKGMIPDRGICPPEYLGKIPHLFEDLLGEYQKRGINLIETIK